LLGMARRTGFELGEREEVEVGFDVAGALAAGAAGFANRVLARPAAVNGVLEDLVEKGEEVSHRLGLEAVGEHGGADVFDIGGRDLDDGAVAEARTDVHPLHRLAALEVGPARALDGEAATEVVGGLVDGDARGDGGGSGLAFLAILLAAEDAFSFGAGESVARADFADRSEAPIEESAVAGAPATVVGAVLDVDVPGSVSALGAHSHSLGRGSDGREAWGRSIWSSQSLMAPRR
jgi:hypothetical protein